MKHIYLLLLCCCLWGTPLRAEQEAEPVKEPAIEAAEYKKAKAWYKKLTSNVKNATATLKKVKAPKQSPRALKKMLQIRKSMPGYDKTRVNKDDDDPFDSSSFVAIEEKLQKVLTEEQKLIVRENQTDLKLLNNLLSKERDRVDKFLIENDTIDDDSVALYNTTGEILNEVSEILRICGGDDDFGLGGDED